MPEEARAEVGTAFYHVHGFLDFPAFPTHYVKRDVRPSFLEHVECGYGLVVHLAGFNRADHQETDGF